MQAQGQNESGYSPAWDRPCDTPGMTNSPGAADLTTLAARYGVVPEVVDDLYVRRRAGAGDAELINLLRQQDRGRLNLEHARALVAELPAH